MKVTWFYLRIQKLGSHQTDDQTKENYFFFIPWIYWQFIFQGWTILFFDRGEVILWFFLQIHVADDEKNLFLCRIFLSNLWWLELFGTIRFLRRRNWFFLLKVRRFFLQIHISMRAEWKQASDWSREKFVCTFHTFGKIIVTRIGVPCDRIHSWDKIYVNCGPGLVWQAFLVNWWQIKVCVVFNKYFR